MHATIKKITLKPENNKRLVSLCGPSDDNLKQLERRLQVIVYRHNYCFKLTGFSLSVQIAGDALISLYSDTESYSGKINEIDPEQVDLTINRIQKSKKRSKLTKQNNNNLSLMDTKIVLKYKTIIPRTLNQLKYILNIYNHDITFGIGPSGTGKTYLAIAVAIDLLDRQKNQHIILSRPVTETGEKLGFLPGDFHQKIAPYIQPLYDALYDILGYKKTIQLIQKNIIEVIPLAYMRGRTLNNSIIILDESQNTTIAQMKMFLTRIGFNSIAIITGDITQVDLPFNHKSGLVNAIKILSTIKEISFNFFSKEDSIRHTIVTKIINAYEEYEVNYAIF